MRIWRFIKEAPSRQELNKAFEVNDTFGRNVESDENGDFEILIF